jgi:hypothetical protein
METTMRSVIVATLVALTAIAVADGGPTMLRVSSETVLSTTGSTRASFYPASCKLLTLGEKTHITWLDAVSEIMVQTFDHATGELLPAVHVGTGKDNHSGAAMCADSEGYIYMVFGPHHGEFQFARSARSNDSSEWETLAGFGTKATYPSLVCDADDTLHICYRGGDAPCRLMYQRLPKGGEWSDPRELVSACVPDGYTQFGNALTVAPDGSLHLSYHIYDLHPAAGKSVGHMRSLDGGDTWQLMDGTPLELPVTPEMDAFVEQGPALNMRAGNVVCDAQSRPYFISIHLEDGGCGATLWRWRDGWESVALGPLLAPLMDVPPSFTSGMTATIDSAGDLYLGLCAAEKYGWGTPTSEVFVLRSTDLGDSFEVVQASATDRTVSNWGPNFERPVGHNTVGLPMLLYTHGAPGAGCSPDDRTEVRLVVFERGE